MEKITSSITEFLVVVFIFFGCLSFVEYTVKIADYFRYAPTENQKDNCKIIENIGETK